MIQICIRCCKSKDIIIQKMHNKIIILSIIVLFIPIGLISQSHYQVDLAEFSSKKYAEFCPVIFNNQIIFTSNQETELLINNGNKSNTGAFNIYKIDIDPENWDAQPEVFSQSLLTPFNDGPVSFNPDGKLIVYSRNVDTKTTNKNIFDLKNTLGLYFAELDEGEWINPVEFKYNSKEYSITTPCFSADGNYLYFGSDMPGGYGGTDLYRSRFINGEWTEPENLGEKINTKGNEVYPYIAKNGDLFFASDGHGGLGKKDIFLSRFSGLDWITPVQLDPPINSKEDDFGLVTDGEFSKGFFSSARGRTDDIYQFSTLIPQLFDCDTVLENQYCYEFWDDLYPGMNSLPVIYEWEFSDGVRLKGLRVEHCLPGAGKYWANLNIIDNSTSNTFFTQTSMEFELEEHVQPYITCDDAGIVESDMEFSGLESYLPGFITEEYIWDFGDGNFNSGQDITHHFNKSGVYAVKMGVKGYTEGNDNKELRCVIKPVTILPDNQALAMYLSGMDLKLVTGSENMNRDSSEVIQDFSVFEVNPEEEVFRVEVLSSDAKIMLDDSLFNPLRDKYDIKEFYFSGDSLYSYTVGEFNSLLSTYDIYADVVDKGFTSAMVKTYVLAELPTEVVAKINRDFAELADANFEFNQSEVSENTYPMLDKVVNIMNENPDLVMEIAAHTDNVGSFEFNMELSQKRAQSIVDYMISKGIDKIRLFGKGYGESRPISSNNTEDGRMENRRVEFMILNKN